MAAIRANGVTDRTWADIDLIEIVTQWLDNHGVDMHTPALRESQLRDRTAGEPGLVTRYAGEMTEPGVIA